MANSSDDSRPASLQVADALRNEIASGALAPGDKLPSIRNLAERFQVAPMTAQSAMDVLRSEGLIYSSPGRGTFVRARPDDASGPSPEYQALSEHLSELDTQMRAIADRVNELEKLVRPEGQGQR
ncbi:MAG: GntR family transcriptional regulator [Streptosporangiaceae bacterium]|jgi:DNA-binding GntR family transcriptional regulator